MLPYFSQHVWQCRKYQPLVRLGCQEAVQHARTAIAEAINARPREIVFTSGATESNNLAIRGLAERRRRRGNHIVSVQTEHKAILDPLARLAQRDFEVTLLPVVPHGDEQAGLVSVDGVGRGHP